MDGHESYWQCSICEKYFEDALATKEITDLSSLTIKASHEFETTWSVDELHHWYACTKCQTEKKSYAEHVYSSIGDTDCNICGYVRVLPDRIVVEDIFKDVTKGSWCVASIQFVYEKGIMNGKSAATFGTGDSITRAEFAQVLYNMEGKPSVQFQDKFIDVNESQWFAKAVSWAYAKQIASGYGNGSFGVNDSITREQLAVMLYKYAGVKGYSQAGSQDDLEKFTDLDTIHSWAETAMNWAVDQGIMSGRKQADGSYLLDPAGKATRAECAAMLKNFCEAFGR